MWPIAKVQRTAGAPLHLSCLTQTATEEPAPARSAAFTCAAASAMFSQTTSTITSNVGPCATCTATATTSGWIYHTSRCLWYSVPDWPEVVAHCHPPRTPDSYACSGDVVSQRRRHEARCAPRAAARDARSRSFGCCPQKCNASQGCGTRPTQSHRRLELCALRSCAAGVGVRRTQIPARAVPRNVLTGRAGVKRCAGTYGGP